MFLGAVIGNSAGRILQQFFEFWKLFDKDRIVADGKYQMPVEIDQKFAKHFSNLGLSERLKFF